MKKTNKELTKENEELQKNLKQFDVIITKLRNRLNFIQGLATENLI